RRAAPVAQHMRKQNGARGRRIVLQHAQVAVGQALAAQLAGQLQAVQAEGARALPDRADQRAREFVFVAQALRAFHGKQLVVQIAVQALAQIRQCRGVLCHGACLLRMSPQLDSPVLVRDYLFPVLDNQAESCDSKIWTISWRWPAPGTWDARPTAWASASRP